eukprot:6195461-Pleurochrysis_carterae.AAC.5
MTHSSQLRDPFVRPANELNDFAEERCWPRCVGSRLWALHVQRVYSPRAGHKRGCWGIPGSLGLLTAEGGLGPVWPSARHRERLHAAGGEDGDVALDWGRPTLGETSVEMGRGMHDFILIRSLFNAQCELHPVIP